MKISLSLGFRLVLCILCFVCAFGCSESRKEPGLPFSSIKWIEWEIIGFKCGNQRPLTNSDYEMISRTYAASVGGNVLEENHYRFIGILQVLSEYILGKPNKVDSIMSVNRMNTFVTSYDFAKRVSAMKFVPPSETADHSHFDFVMTGLVEVSNDFKLSDSTTQKTYVLASSNTVLNSRLTNMFDINTPYIIKKSIKIDDDQVSTLCTPPTGTSPNPLFLVLEQSKKYNWN